MTTRDLAQRFVEALDKLERDGDVDGLVSLFDDDCQLGNTAAPRVFRGRDEVRRFWKEYRGSFGKVHSRFRNVVASEGFVVLEWHTEGTAPDGTPIAYDGVSLLELEGEKVRRFHAYFDPRHLGRQLYEHAAHP